MGEGRITHGPETTLIERTIEFIQSSLPGWRDDADRPSEHAENKLSNHLNNYLNVLARFNFPNVHFGREEPQTGKSAVDLAAKPVRGGTVIRSRTYSKYDAFLVIECKILPAPPPKHREREYVTGRKRSGGIQRFKLGIHGVSHERAMLVGYIIEHDNEHWCRVINQWIAALQSEESKDTCIWEVADGLRDLSVNGDVGISRCRSRHRRIENAISPFIELEHIWVAMHHHNAVFGES